MNLGLVAVGIGAPGRWIVWTDRGLIALCAAAGLVFLPRTVRELVRVAGWDRAGVGWPHRQQAAWLTAAVLLAVVGLGSLFLAIDLSSRHPGAFWVQLGLMTFIRPIQRLWNQSSTPPMYPGRAWLTETKLEVYSGVLCVLMGVLNSLGPG